MANTYIVQGFRITEDPDFQDERMGITPELKSQLESLYYECQDEKNKTIVDKLVKLIDRYPQVPILKNFLSSAYMTKENTAKAMEINQRIRVEHPDYLFGLLNGVHLYLMEKNYSKAVELLGSGLDIRMLYPDRDVFHLSEITAYLKTVISYLVSIKNRDLAEQKLALLEEIAPDHPDTKTAQNYLFTLLLENAVANMKKKLLHSTKPVINKANKMSPTKTAPSFHHTEVEKLYYFEFNIPVQILEEILELPHETLAQDLEIMLEDASQRFDYFQSNDLAENETYFPLHALFLLAEIKAEESLSKVLAFFQKDDAFLDFWLGDHLTSTLWACIYHLGYNQTKELQAFLLLPGICTYSKTCITEALCQMVLHHPEKRDEILAVFDVVFTGFLHAEPEDNLVDSEYLGLAVSDTAESRFVELLPLVKQLFDKGFVHHGISGDFEEVQKICHKPFDPRYTRKLQSIVDLYKEESSVGNANSPFKNPVPFVKPASKPAVSNKIGRNEPCPCGSGKKYKKCCL